MEIVGPILTMTVCVGYVFRNYVSIFLNQSEHYVDVSFAEE